MAGDNLGSLVKDKRVQVGAAVVGGVGLLMLVMRKGGSSSGAGQTMIQPAAGVNSSGADLYNALQGLGQGWQNDLQGFTAQLSNVNDKLSKLPTGGPGNPPTAPAPGPTPAAPKASGPVSGSVQQGWFVDQWILDMQKGYGPGAAALQQGQLPLWENIYKLNPGILSNINWSKNGDHTKNTFKNAGSYRIV